MVKRQSREDAYLKALQGAQVPVIVRLLNDIHLRGRIESFDQLSILIRYDLEDTVDQLVQKSAIAVIKPVGDHMELHMWKAGLS